MILQGANGGRTLDCKLPASVVDFNLNTDDLFLDVSGEFSEAMDPGVVLDMPGSDGKVVVDWARVKAAFAIREPNRDGVGVKVRYSVSDSGGQEWMVERTVVLIDATAPAISAVQTNTREDPLVVKRRADGDGDGTFVGMPTPTAKDVVDGDVTAQIVTTVEYFNGSSVQTRSSVDIRVSGDYKIIFSVDDSSGNTATATLWVRVSEYAPGRASGTEDEDGGGGGGGVIAAVVIVVLLLLAAAVVGAWYWKKTHADRYDFKPQHTRRASKYSGQAADRSKPAGERRNSKTAQRPAVVNPTFNDNDNESEPLPMPPGMMAGKSEYESMTNNQYEPTANFGGDEGPVSIENYSEVDKATDGIFGGVSFSKATNKAGQLAAPTTFDPYVQPHPEQPKVYEANRASFSEGPDDSSSTTAAGESYGNPNTLRKAASNQKETLYDDDMDFNQPTYLNAVSMEGDEFAVALEEAGGNYDNMMDMDMDDGFGTSDPSPQKRSSSMRMGPTTASFGSSEEGMYGRDRTQTLPSGFSMGASPSATETAPEPPSRNTVSMPLPPPPAQEHTPKTKQPKKKAKSRGGGITNFSYEDHVLGGGPTQGQGQGQNGGEGDKENPYMNQRAVDVDAEQKKNPKAKPAQRGFSYEDHDIPFKSPRDKANKEKKKTKDKKKNICSCVSISPAAHVAECSLCVLSACLQLRCSGLRVFRVFILFCSICGDLMLVQVCECFRPWMQAQVGANHGHLLRVSTASTHVFPKSWCIHTR